MRLKKPFLVMIGLLVCIGEIVIYIVATRADCLPGATATVMGFPVYPGAQAVCFTPGVPSFNNPTAPFLTSWLSFRTDDSSQDVLLFYRQTFQASSDGNRSEWRVEDYGTALVFINGIAPDVLFTNPAEFERDKARYVPTHVVISTITPGRTWLPWQKTHVDVRIQQVDLFE